MDDNKKDWRNVMKRAVKVYRDGWRLAPGLLAYNLCTMLVFDIALAYAIIYVNRAIAVAVTEQSNASLALICIAALFVVKISTKLLQILGKVVNTKIAISFRLNDENRIFEKAERVKYELLEAPSYYNTYSMVDANVSSSVLNFVTDVHKSVFYIVNAAISIGILISHHAWLGVILVLLEIPFAALNLKYYEYQIKFRRKDAPKRRRIKELTGLLGEKKSVIDIKLNSANDFIIDKMNEDHMRLYDSLCKKNKIKIITDSLTDIYRDIRGVGLILFYLLRVLGGSLTIADYTLMMSLIEKASSAVSEPVNYFGIILDDLQYVSDYYDFINLEDERVGKEGVKLPEDNTVPCDIEIKNFSFAYPESDTEVLENIDLKIKAGEIIALVGENGAGKTTLVKNILGLYETYGGHISIDGIDYRDIAARDIYDRFSAVMQDYMKYPFTLRDNITISDSTREKPDDRFIDEIMEKTDGKRIVEAAEYGYDTYLSKETDENGTDLSEGQWQKIMLARALYRNRGMMIFDEPTASLDPIAEEAFYRNIIDKANGRTVIIVTHRLACTAVADRVVVMKKGRIAEIGTHAELMKKNGIYAEMYHTQADGYSVVQNTAEEGTHA